MVVMEARQVVGPNRSEGESSVLDALAASAAGLSLNAVTEHCGGATARTSHALSALEAKGMVRFRGGRWTLGPHRAGVLAGERIRRA
jgi:DNA-binding IclR family transcriptional regulator